MKRAKSQFYSYCSQRKEEVIHILAWKLISFKLVNSIGSFRRWYAIIEIGCCINIRNWIYKQILFVNNIIKWANLDKSKMYQDWVYCIVFLFLN